MSKTILITGASRGIGRATALLAAERGWSVGVNYVGNQAAAGEVVALVKSRGANAVSLQGDVAQERDVLAVFDGCQQALGQLDGVVVNAGIVASPATLMDMSAERLRRMFEVNSVGAYLCAREAARRMAVSRGGKGGSIVLVSSVAARLGSPFEYVDYAGSKAAVDTLAIGLSKELGQEGVRVNSIRPGVTVTDIHASGGQPDRAHRVGAGTPMGRPGEANEIAEAIIWLLSDAASYTSGAVLDVAGGR
ncbi:SDR family oxidoreductase [Lacibacterium aquatile]|uniref:SDR family oxidoreductase n=1 Tax=Lacibacterium aquatile TaxID=1168082 RepID=A0ABW5DUT3_9PROT